MSLFGFGAAPVEVEIALDGQETRQIVELKEKEKKLKLPVYLGETLSCNYLMAKLFLEKYFCDSKMAKNWIIKALKLNLLGIFNYFMTGVFWAVY